MIIHLDADAFFASVEEAADSRLRGHPLAVGGGTRGVIASANYEARRQGVFTPMPSSSASIKCPGLIVVRPNIERYRLFSRLMFALAEDITPQIERTSIDEGYLDIGGVGNPRGVAQSLQDAILCRLKLPVSIGIASNKLIAQIASKTSKPHGFCFVPAGCEAAFVAPLSAFWLPGIGKKASTRLAVNGIVTIGDIQKSKSNLVTNALRSMAFGEDDTPVVPNDEPAKSVSEQETFRYNITKISKAQTVLFNMADRLFVRLRKAGFSARTITVRLRFPDFRDVQKSLALTTPTDIETDAYGHIETLLNTAWEGTPVRLAGLKLGELQEFKPAPTLFEPHPSPRRRAILAMDEIRAKYGATSIMRGHQLRQDSEE